MRRRLGPAETRSLLELLVVAAARPEGAALLEAAGAQWGRGALGRAAVEAAAACREGRSLSEALASRLPAGVLAALAAAERSGEPAEGLERARELAVRESRALGLVLAPAAYPLLVLALCGVAAILLALLVAPPLHELRVELALLDGRPAPAGLLAFAASHARLVAFAGAAMAVLPLLLPLLLVALSRSGAGARALLRLPPLGAIARWRACADFGSVLADLIEAGLPHDEAWRLAARAVGPRALREALVAAEPVAASGVALPEVLSGAGLPASAVRGLGPRRVGRDGGVEALREMSEAASRRHELLLAAAGRGVAAAAGAGGFACALGLLAAVLLPLLAAGGA